MENLKSAIEKGMQGERVEGIERFEKPLNPEEISSQLQTRRIGKKIHYLSEIDSTNVYARKRAQEGGEEGEIVIAETQSHGKGRLGRRWVSPPYLNLYLSFILRPKLPPKQAPQITLMGAVALAETVQSCVPVAPEIKWPNDIKIGGRKVAGILTESACEADRILFVILGMGVNLNFPLELMPESIQQSATSLMVSVQRPVDRADFARRLIQNLDRCYGDLEDQGFPSIARRWEKFFQLRGKRVRVDMPDRPAFGKAMGIDGEGALILKDERGSLRRIVAGDVIPIDP